MHLIPALKKANVSSRAESMEEEEDLGDGLLQALRIHACNKECPGHWLTGHQSSQLMSSKFSERLSHKRIIEVWGDEL